MRQQTSPAPADTSDTAHADAAWAVALGAARAASRVEAAATAVAFGLCGTGELRLLREEDPQALVTWRPESGWHALVPETDPRRVFLDLYLPIASATAARPMIVAHLGQSLDGFIATHSGDSQFVTGHANIIHLHRLRALCDAVIVGAGTVAADNPQLTTRYVTGANPLRVVLDPGRRLADDYRVFTDASAPTLYVCARALVADGDTQVGGATILGLDGDAENVDVHQLVAELRERGCSRIFVEGGGVTVSAFLEAGLVDRLHVAIAPLLIGDGRPAIRLPAPSALHECLRPSYRVFRMGGDVLFDCQLTHVSAEQTAPHVDAQIERVI